MTALRIAAAAAAAVALTVAGTAHAHGAPTDPVSRVVACGPEGVQRESAVCRAAVAANGGVAFDEWDNVRVADVQGRDREFIPDGELCSAGLDAYKGLDLAREDWPATTLTAGARFTLTYLSTIPQEGTFQLYLTKAGYDPTVPLKWDDLAPEPVGAATDPRLVDGAYRIPGRLPAGLTGSHVLYTVWRNSSTADTYYSCSDLVLTGETAQPQPGGEPPERQAAASAERDADKQAIFLGGVAALLGLLAVAASALVRRRGHR
ncbi:lytic polysaccharide monooxygenase [Streptomyces sp. NPDC001820]|uniref:lytic polysaccharide monooxygenase n=1 Tax=Streptomyces sp. NPDC001820 TaxID=3364613 RepID=UPI0036979C59